MRKLLLILVCGLSLMGYAQSNRDIVRLNGGGTLPSSCRIGDTFFLVTVSGANAVGLYECLAANVWTSGGPVVLADTPLTTRGDLLTVNSTPALVRLAAGGANTVLHGGTDLSYGAVDLAADVTGQLPISRVGSAGLSATAPATISAAGVISVSGVTAEQGNGAKLQLSTGTVTSNVIAKFDANGNTINSSITDTGTAVSTGSSFEADGITSIGGAPNSVVGLWVQSPTLTGTTEYGVLVQAVCSTSATVACNGIQAQAKIASGVVTVPQANTLHVADANNPGPGVITKLVGLEIDTLTQGGTTNLAIETGANPSSFGGKFTTYNNIATVDNGIPGELGHIDSTGNTAALSATTVCTPSATGRFRISVYEKVTTAASVSSILGGATGTVLTYTDGTDSVAQSITMGLDSQGGTVALTNSGNSTTTSLNGSSYIYAKTGVAIQIAVGYTSSGTAMAYQVRATCEAL